MSEFYEDDERPEDAVAAFEHGEQGRTELPHYTAWVSTDRSVVLGDRCEVTVLEDEVSNYRLDEDGREHPVYTSSAKDPLELGPIAVRVDDPDTLEKAWQAATQLLAEYGWRVVGKWDISDNAMYATVELM
jgi:hypothetical protein